MNARERSLKERCAKFGAIISRLDLRALTKRQRQVAKLRVRGLSLQAIAKRLGVTRERVRQIEARLRTRAHIHALQKNISYATSALRRSRKALQRKRIATSTSTGSQISRVR